MGPRLELEATGRPSQTPRLRRYARAAMTDAISRYPAPLPPGWSRDARLPHSGIRCQTNHIRWSYVFALLLSSSDAPCTLHVHHSQMNGTPNLCALTTKQSRRQIIFALSHVRSRSYCGSGRCQEASLLVRVEAVSELTPYLIDGVVELFRELCKPLTQPRGLLRPEPRGSDGRAPHPRRHSRARFAHSGARRSRGHGARCAAGR